jgi:hypothetical protein
MTFSDAGAPQPGSHPPTSLASHLPIVWIGYVLGIATMIAAYVAVSLHPELEKPGAIPPLYFFLPSFVGGVYWLACIYRIHVVLAQIPGWKHPVSPARAVGFHFIPFYNLYWIFRWPREIADFVNPRLPQPIVKPIAIGLSILAALLLRLVIDPGFGLILLFFPITYICECIRRAIAAQNRAPAE